MPTPAKSQGLPWRAGLGAMVFYSAGMTVSVGDHALVQHHWLTFAIWCAGIFLAGVAGGSLFEWHYRPAIHHFIGRGM